MSFSDDFSNCMSSNGLPTPSGVFDSLSDMSEFLHELHTAWEGAGGEEETTLAALVALGAVTGIDETVLAGAGAVTVGAYLAACLACVVSAAGSAVWDEITGPSPIMDLWLRGELTAQADAQNIPNLIDVQNTPDPTFTA